MAEFEEKAKEEIIKQRQLLAYIKLSKILDKERYAIYNTEGYLFIVNLLNNQVLLAFHDDLIIINQEISDIDFDFCINVKDILSLEFDDLFIVQDVFTVDTESRAIYIGKAALDYKQGLLKAQNEERILH